MKIDILGVSETRWTGNGKYVLDDYTFVYSGGEQHEHGVDILMKKEVACQ
jgi:hypothetical protein